MKLTAQGLLNEEEIKEQIKRLSQELKTISVVEYDDGSYEISTHAYNDPTLANFRYKPTKDLLKVLLFLRLQKKTEAEFKRYLFCN